jgi:putative transposase
MMTEVRKTYKYRLYGSKRDERLHEQIDIAGSIWNHVTALQRRYYRLTGSYISESRMKKHIARLRMKMERFKYWRKLGSQAVQEIIERHHKAYQNFFKEQGGRPRFRKVKKLKSFTLKQAGWKLEDENPDKKYRKIRIGKTTYKFVYHRPLQGTIKTVTIKRDVTGDLWICFSVVENMVIGCEISTGNIGGFDFGLKHFLTNNEGQTIQAPEFFRDDLPRLRKIQQQVSKKVKGSQNQQAGLKHLARRYVSISDRRRDFHFQLAHDLCDQYDILIFEDLNFEGMKRLWGRKVSDLGFTQFITILQWVAFKRGKQIIFIDRWERTTGRCSACGHMQKVELKDRVFGCEHCGLIIDRDHNAARNILEAGHRLILSQSVEVLANAGHPAFTSDAHSL